MCLWGGCGRVRSHVLLGGLHPERDQREMPPEILPRKQKMEKIDVVYRLYKTLDK